MTLLSAIVGLAKIDTLETDSFANDSDAQTFLCAIQSQFNADGSLAGVVIDDDWIESWNQSELSVRVDMLLSYVKSEMQIAISTELDL